jgi:ribosomal protein S18 acetylase RimI-like enzyme
MLRLLLPGDEAALEAFLRQHADSSMFLRSNLRAAGLTYSGAPLEAEYVAAFAGDRIVTVVAHCWNGMVLVQAPEQVGEVARAAVAQSGRSVSGIAGPTEQVVAARTALGLDDRPGPKFGREQLFALELAALVVPAALADGRWTCRPPRDDELELVVGWRVQFMIEALHRAPGAGLRDEAAATMGVVHERRSHWLLFDAGRPVAYSAFNAALPDIVQIGGVWTPPDLRSRGYGRAVVAGSLLDVRARGVTRAVLFAEREDAKRAYRGLGFVVVGEYALVLFDSQRRAHLCSP